MAIFDLILVIILGGFILFGLWFGLIHTLGALVGITAGAWIAGHYYLVLSDWLGRFFGSGNVLKTISFIVIFILANRLIGLIFYVIDRIFNFVAIIPFLKTINRLAGATLGLIEGVLVIGTSLYVASRYPLGDWFNQGLARSDLAHWLVRAAKIITPLLPEVIRQLKSLI